ncbi:MAG: GAF domain-containing protein [Chloroflexi bacterium]|nr:GAF domain-containing protein [Chloroflexota bacterium]MBP8056639.1 GAF domain-containing protein [Chloroflexota bacterium]
MSSDFYALLSYLLEQMACTPHYIPPMPVQEWPAGSPERQVLEKLQAALLAREQQEQKRLAQAEQQFQARVEARLREQATLLNISQTMASALELKPGLILDQLRVIIEYTHAALFTLEEWTLVALAVRGPQHLEETMPFRIRLDGPEMLAALLNGHRPQRIADVANNELMGQFLPALLYEQAAALLAGVHALMWVPLAVKGQIIGGMVVAHIQPDYFTSHHGDLALTMANQAAITLINARLYEQAQTVAVLEERQRLAQNLHDAVNQSLFSAGLIAEVLPRLWERDPESGRRSLQDLRQLTRGALAEMRGLLGELQPLILTDTELGDLLRQLGSALTGRTNVPVSVMVEGQGVLPADVQVTFYRLCQEGLNNIAKHARANQVTIRLQYLSEGVAIHIHDNGRGFDREHIPPGHYGLSIMFQRAKAIGANLTVSSQPGEGTEIVIVWTGMPKQGSL